MNELLETLTKDLVDKYGKGGIGDLSEIANTIPDGDVSTRVCFYDCFADINLSSTPQGGTLETHPFVIWVLMPCLETVNDPIEIRLPRIKRCALIAKRLFEKLQAVGDVTNANLSPALAKTTRSMDGVRFTGFFKGDPDSIC